MYGTSAGGSIKVAINMLYLEGKDVITHKSKHTNLVINLTKTNSLYMRKSIENALLFS